MAELVRGASQECKIRGCTRETDIVQIRELKSELQAAVDHTNQEIARLGEQVVQKEHEVAEARRVRDSAIKGTVLWRTNWRTERDRADQAETEVALLRAVIDRLEGEYQDQKAENAKMRAALDRFASGYWHHSNVRRIARAALAGEGQ